jgi:hypothetical protein
LSGEAGFVVHASSSMDCLVLMPVGIEWWYLPQRFSVTESVALT